MELAVNVPAHRDGTADLLDIGLLRQDLFSLWGGVEDGHTFNHRNNTSVKLKEKKKGGAGAQIWAIIHRRGLTTAVI